MASMSASDMTRGLKNLGGSMMGGVVAVLFIGICLGLCTKAIGQPKSGQ